MLRQNQRCKCYLSWYLIPLFMYPYGCLNRFYCLSCSLICAVWPSENYFVWYLIALISVTIHWSPFTQSNFSFNFSKIESRVYFGAKWIFNNFNRIGSFPVVPQWSKSSQAGTLKYGMTRFSKFCRPRLERMREENILEDLECQAKWHFWHPCFPLEQLHFLKRRCSFCYV